MHFGGDALFPEREVNNEAAFSAGTVVSAFV